MTQVDRRRRLAGLVESRMAGVVACALAFALATLRIDAKSMWWDESLSLLRAQSSLGDILSGRIVFGGIASIDQHPPLYFLALGAMRALAGESDFALRLLSALATALTVAVSYALARRLLGGHVAGMAALLVAASPLLIWYGQEARMYTLATLLALLALYAAWRTTAAWSWVWALVALLTTAAAAATHYLTVLFTLPALLAAWHRPHRALGRDARDRHPAVMRPAITALGIVAISAAVATAVLRRLPSESVYNEPALSLGAMLVDAFNSYSLGLSVNLRHVWWIDLIFALVWMAGIAALFAPAVLGRRAVLLSARLRRLALLLLVLLAPILAVWLLTRRLPFYINSRYVMFSAPLFAIGLARGLAGRRFALARWALALGLFASMSWSLHRYYLHPYYASKEDYAGAAAYITAQELPGDLLFINGPESQAAFEHYYSGQMTPRSLPDMTVRPWDLTTALPRLTEGSERVWLVGGRRNFSDPDSYLRRWLEQHMIEVGVKTFESSGAIVSVSLYLAHDPVQDAAVGTTPLALAGPARLLDAQIIAWPGPAEKEVELSGQTPQARVCAGEALAARLTWGLAEPTPDLKASLRLVRAGMVWAQQDARPVERLPSALWPSGADITHTLALQLPAGLPPASYELQLWAYDGETGANWPFERHTGTARAHLPLGAVQVEPVKAGDTAWRPPLASLLTPQWGSGNSAVQLVNAAPLPERLLPGQVLPLRLDWRWNRQPAPAYEITINWVRADGQVHASDSFSLLGPGALSDSAAQIDAAQILYPLTAPAPAGLYSLHLLVYDSTQQRFLALRYGPLPGMSKDLKIGQISIGP